MNLHNVHKLNIHFRFKVRATSTSSASTTSNIEVQSPEADTSAPPPPPISIYTYKSCQSGPLIDASQLPSIIEDTVPVDLAKKFICELLKASNKAETILARLSTLRGEDMVISHGGNSYTIKLPSVTKSGDLENVFSALAQCLGFCQNLFSRLNLIYRFHCYSYYY